MYNNANQSYKFCCLRLFFILIPLLCSNFLVDCSNERYKISEDSEGRTIRLDKKTGEVHIIKDNKLIKVIDQEEYTSEFAAPKEFLPLTNASSDSAFLTTQWRNGKLNYKIELLPIPKDLENSSSQFPVILVMKDEYDFEVVENEIFYKRISPIFENDDIIGAEIQGTVKISAENYQAIENWNIKVNQ